MVNGEMVNGEMVNGEMVNGAAPCRLTHVHKGNYRKYLISLNNKQSRYVAIYKCNPFIQYTSTYIPCLCANP